MLLSYDEHGRKRLTPLGVAVLYAIASLVAVLIVPLDYYSNGVDNYRNGVRISAARYEIENRLIIIIPVIVTVFSAWRMRSWLALSLPFIALIVGRIAYLLGALHGPVSSANSLPDGYFASVWFLILMGSAIAGYVLHLIVKAVRAGIDF